MRKRLAAETPAAPDLVRRDFTATAPSEPWVADITYVPTWEGWLFLAVVADVFTRRNEGLQPADRHRPCCRQLDPIVRVQ